jgi:MoxR-like ATPase
MPTAEVVFLDEIFKSNSAILNTLLTLINERKYYQDGRPTPVRMKMLFAATNAVPEFDELAALRDRFPLKIESPSVKDRFFDELLASGLANEGMRNFKRKPWAGLTALEDFLKLKRWLDYQMAEADDRKRWFPDDVYEVFKSILRALEKEDRVQVSDRKVIKLYRLLRTRAFLLHGGAVRKEDLTLLRYVGDRDADFGPVRKKVDAYLKIER